MADDKKKPPPSPGDHIEFTAPRKRGWPKAPPKSSKPPPKPPPKKGD